MILIIDNYDSFVHNLARYIREAGMDVLVVRNDEKSARDCVHLALDGVVLSPGPKTPSAAGVCLELLAMLPPATPLLGVCLGHQCLIEAFGGETVRAKHPMHGQSSVIAHNGDILFSDLPPKIEAGRYHSLIGAPGAGSPLIETAWTEEGDLMAVAHRDRPWRGVQFHPESVLTPHGRLIMQNFLALCGLEEAA